MYPFLQYFLVEPTGITNQCLRITSCFFLLFIDANTSFALQMSGSNSLALSFNKKKTPQGRFFLLNGGTDGN